MWDKSLTPFNPEMARISSWNLRNANTSRKMVDNQEGGIEVINNHRNNNNGNNNRNNYHINIDGNGISCFYNKWRLIHSG